VFGPIDETRRELADLEDRLRTRELQFQEVQEMKSNIRWLKTRPDTAKVAAAEDLLAEKTRSLDELTASLFEQLTALRDRRDGLLKVPIDGYKRAQYNFFNRCQELLAPIAPSEFPPLPDIPVPPTTVDPPVASETLPSAEEVIPATPPRASAPSVPETPDSILSPASTAPLLGDD
jgi:hypothetical protein